MLDLWLQLEGKGLTFIDLLLIHLFVLIGQNFDNKIRRDHGKIFHERYIYESVDDSLS